MRLLVEKEELISVETLLDVCTKMYTSNIVLDEDAIRKLQDLGFKNPVDFANYCFKSGWNEAIKVMLQTLRKE